jgi:hypothetical protein
MSNDADSVRARADILQGLTNQFVAREISREEFHQRLEEAAVSHGEANTYILQADTRRLEGDGSGIPPNTEPNPPIPPQESDDSGSGSQTAPGRAPSQTADPSPLIQSNEDVWSALSNLCSSASANASGQRQPIPSASSLSASSIPAASQTNLVGVCAQSPVPAVASGVSLLAAVPHLAALANNVGDPHIDETFRIRKALSVDKAADEAIDLLQQQSFEEPMPKAIWKDVVLDRLVLFDKLFAAIDSKCDWNDDTREFGAGLILLKKDQYSQRKPVRLESEWLRVYGAWEAAVVAVYPHRKAELSKYRKFVAEIFRAVVDPAVAIRFDGEVRARYAKTPFRMDTHDELRVPLFAQMFSAARTQTYAAPNKRASTNDQPAAKRVQAVCENWNMGRCEDTPCRNRRRHGVCCECQGSHRAKDVDTCFEKLQDRKQRLVGGGKRAGDGKN